MGGRRLPAVSLLRRALLAVVVLTALYLFLRATSPLDAMVTLFVLGAAAAGVAVTVAVLRLLLARQ